MGHTSESAAKAATPGSTWHAFLAASEYSSASKSPKDKQWSINADFPEWHVRGIWSQPSIGINDGVGGHNGRLVYPGMALTRGKTGRATTVIWEVHCKVLNRVIQGGVFYVLGLASRCVCIVKPAVVHVTRWTRMRMFRTVGQCAQRP